MKPSKHFCFRLIYSIYIPFLFLSFLNCANRHNDKDEKILLGLSLIDNSTTKRVLILGDSLTQYSQGFGLTELVAGQFSIEWKGALNKNITHWTSRLPGALLSSGDLPFDAIVFPMGTNDAFLFSAPEFSNNLLAFHSRVRDYSSAHIFYVQVSRTNDLSLQPQVVANNLKLATILPTDATSLIDIDTAFMQEPSFSLLYPPADPLHPNLKGNNIIAHLIKNSLLSTSF